MERRDRQGVLDHARPGRRRGGDRGDQRLLRRGRRRAPDRSRRRPRQPARARRRRGRGSAVARRAGQLLHPVADRRQRDHDEPARQRAARAARPARPGGAAARRSHADRPVRRGGAALRLAGAVAVPWAQRTGDARRCRPPRGRPADGAARGGEPRRGQVRSGRRGAHRPLRRRLAGPRGVRVRHPSVPRCPAGPSRGTRRPRCAARRHLGAAVHRRAARTASFLLRGCTEVPLEAVPAGSPRTPVSINRRRRAPAHCGRARTPTPAPAPGAAPAPR